MRRLIPCGRGRPVLYFKRHIIPGIEHNSRRRRGCLSAQPRTALGDRHLLLTWTSRWYATMRGSARPLWFSCRWDFGRDAGCTSGWRSKGGRERVHGGALPHDKARLDRERPHGRVCRAGPMAHHSCRVTPACKRELSRPCTQNLAIGSPDMYLPVPCRVCRPAPLRNLWSAPAETRGMRCELAGGAVPGNQPPRRSRSHYS